MVLMVEIPQVSYSCVPLFTAALLNFLKSREGCIHSRHKWRMDVGSEQRISSILGDGLCELLRYGNSA